MVLLAIIVPLSSCGQRMNQEEIETLKIEETIGRYMDGYAKNDADQIIETMYLEEKNKDDLKTIMNQVLETIHQDFYSFKISYNIDELYIYERTAQTKLSAILRVFEDDEEIFSVRLFRDKNLFLIKDDEGEWKIDFKQFIPEEFLKLEFFF